MIVVVCFAMYNLDCNLNSVTTLHDGDSVEDVAHKVVGHANLARFAKKKMEKATREALMLVQKEMK